MAKKHEDKHGKPDEDLLKDIEMKEQELVLANDYLNTLKMRYDERLKRQQSL